MDTQGKTTPRTRLVVIIGPIAAGKSTVAGLLTEQLTTAGMGHVPPGTSTQRVLLLASYDSALNRVARQRRRGGSRDPEFLRAMYDRFESLVPQLDACDLTFDTGEVVAEEIARQITAHILEPDD